MLNIFRRVPKHRVIIDIMLSLIWSAINCYYLTMLSALSSSISSDRSTILKISLYYIGFIILWELEEWIEDVYNNITLAHIENNISKYYFSQAYFIKPSVLKKSNTGYISGLLNKIISSEVNLYRLFTLMLPLSILHAIYFSIRLSFYHPAYGILLVTIVLLGLSLQLTGNKMIEKRANALNEAAANKDKLFIDTIVNIGTVQKMQAHKFMIDKMSKINDTFLKKTKDWSIFNEFIFCGYKAIIYLYAPLLILVYMLVGEGNTARDQEMLSLISVISVQTVHLTRNIAEIIVDYIKYKNLLAKMHNIISEENIRQEIIDNDFKSAEINNIEYRYNDEENKTHMIKIPQFRVEKGDHICIEGESGQGKTTLMNILSGEIETDPIKINGEYTNKRLNCVFVSQDTEIFDMTLRENLTLGNKNIKDSQIEAMIDQVGLQDWYNTQENKLDTMLGEKGVFVSTGQRQRINLLRGLLVQDKEIYLLDEPTSNVDEITEQKMVKLIEEKLKDKTVIIVTHKPKIKEICNKHYTFKNGVLHKD